jgi:hypothetical protein
VSNLLSSTDIELDGIPLRIHRPRSRRPGTDYDPAHLPWGFGAVDAASRIQTQAVPRRWRDWSGGMGYQLAPGNPEQTGVYHYADNVDTMYPNLAMAAGLVTPVTLPGTIATAAAAAFEWTNGDLYFLCGRYAVKLAEGSGAPTVVADLGASFTATSAVVFRTAAGAAAAYVGGTSAGAPALIWQFDGTNWTQSANVLGKFLFVVDWYAGGLFATRMGVTDTDASFKYTTVAAPNPLSDADYSSSIKVGSVVYPIKSVGRFPERVFFPKANGIHDVFADDAGNVRVRNLTPYWERQIDSSNGTYVLPARDHLYASFAGGLDRIDVTNLQRQDSPEWCDVGAYVANESPIYGTGPMALERSAVVQAKYNPDSGDTHVMYGLDRRDVGRPGVGPMAWHGSMATVEGLSPTLLHYASPGGNPRMWMWFQDGSTPYLRWLSRPKAATPLQDWLNNGPMRFAALGSLFNSADAWGASSDQKIIQWFTLQTRNLGGGALIDLYANAEHGAFSAQGSARRSPRTRITPRSPAVTGYTIGTEIVFKSGASVPAILEEVTAYAEVNTELAEQRRYPIVLARGGALRSGADEYRVPSNLWRLINPLQQTGPVTLKDETGETLTVNVQAGIGGETVEDDDGKGWTRIANLDLTVLSRTHGRVMRWGVGDRWGANYVYGNQSVTGSTFHWGLGSRWGRGEVYAAAS